VARSRADLLLENALLRHQLVVLSRTTKRPRLTAADRKLLVLVASRLRTGAGALVITAIPVLGGLHDIYVRAA
jgi:hypothetical protein